VPLKAPEAGRLCPVFVLCLLWLQMPCLGEGTPTVAVAYSVFRFAFIITMRRLFMAVVWTRFDRSEQNRGRATPC